MASTTDKARSTRRSIQASGIRLFLSGIIGLLIGEAIFVTLMLAHVTSNDAYMGVAFLATFLIPIASIVILISLFLLKVNWIPAIGAILFPLLLAAYWSKPLFNNASDYVLLTYGSGVIVLSLILVLFSTVINRKSSKTSQ